MPIAQEFVLRGNDGKGSLNERVKIAPECGRYNRMSGPQRHFGFMLVVGYFSESRLMEQSGPGQPHFPDCRVDAAASLLAVRRHWSSKAAPLLPPASVPSSLQN